MPPLYEFLINLLLHPYESPPKLIIETPGGLPLDPMSFKIDQLEVDSAAARRRPIELITENGFSIVRADEIGDPSPAPVDTYVFMVRDPHGSELEIRVGIDRRAINEIMLASRGRISTESSYWIACAERHLAGYVWEHDDYPPGATLRVETLTPRDLNLVHRWEMS